MPGKILALGFFDGVHSGHARLLHTAVSLAREQRAVPMAVSFATHPSQLLSGQSLPLLSSVTERRRLMEECGVEETLFLPFDESMRSTPWERFLSRLTEQQQALGYVAGYDYRFGCRGEGNVERLEQWCSSHGLLCRVIPAVTLGGVPVSSTHIRALLGQGRLEEAVRFLGHPYLFCARGGDAFLPWDPSRLPLPPGVYRADIALPDGTCLPEQAVTCLEGGILLPFIPPAGGLSLSFTGRADL